MKIKVLFFAQLREVFGGNETVLEVSEGSNVKEVVRSLFDTSRFSHLKQLPLLYSRNENFVKGDEKLMDQDTLALLPPVAGG